MTVGICYRCSHQNRVSNRDIADVEFVWWVDGWGGVGCGGWGLQSHFHVQPNNGVEVVLRCVVVGVVTIVLFIS